MPGLARSGVPGATQLHPMEQGLQDHREFFLIYSIRTNSF